jgi:hypothetical protein
MRATGVRVVPEALSCGVVGAWPPALACVVALVTGVRVLVEALSCGVDEVRSDVCVELLAIDVRVVVAALTFGVTDVWFAVS